MEPLLAEHPSEAPVSAIRRAPAPPRGGPLALLRFMRANHMLSRAYLHLLARFVYLKLSLIHI